MEHGIQEEELALPSLVLSRKEKERLQGCQGAPRSVKRLREQFVLPFEHQRVVALTVGKDEHLLRAATAS